MAENSKIEWTDHTFNPWIGCAKVAAGCTHCYAEAFAKRYGKATWGEHGTRVLTSPANWKLPLKWNREAEKAGERHRVFCASLADVFEDWQEREGAMTCYKTGEDLSVNQSGHVWPIGWPSLSDGDDWGARPYTMADARRRLFNLIAATPNLDWLVLTKRPENIRRMWPSVVDRSAFLANEADPNPNIHPRTHRRNCWLGTSIATQADADKNIPELLKCRDLAPVLFVSAEPLLGLVDLCSIPTYSSGSTRIETNVLSGESLHQSHDGGAGMTRSDSQRIDWLIVGGESGRGARPCDLSWIRQLVTQCKASEVPVFVKQLGSLLTVKNDSAMEWPKHGDEWVYADPDYMPRYQGEETTLRMESKGGDWSEWPEDLRVREFPCVARNTK